MTKRDMTEIRQLTSGVIEGRQVARGIVPVNAPSLPGGFQRAIDSVEQSAIAKRVEGLAKLKEWMLGEGINKAIRKLQEIDDPGEFLKNFVNVFELVDGKKQRVQVKRTITKQMVKAPDWVDSGSAGEGNTYSESIEQTVSDGGNDGD